MPGDHEFFVRTDHVSRDLALRLRNQRPAGVVGSAVKLDAKPCKLFRNARANVRGILANAGGEDECVETIERRCQHSGIQCDSIHEVFDRKRRGVVVVPAPLLTVWLTVPELLAKVPATPA